MIVFQDLISSEIITLFNDADCDAMNSPFSLQQLIPLTFSLHSLSAGDFFTGPKVLETLSVLNQIYNKLNIAIIQFVDGCIFIDEILEEVAGGGEQEAKDQKVLEQRTVEEGKTEEGGIKILQKENNIKIFDEVQKNFEDKENDIEKENEENELAGKDINQEINDNSIRNRKRSYSLVDPRPALIVEPKRESCCYFFRKKGFWTNLCPSCRIWEKSVLITVCLGLGERKVNRKTEEFVRKMLELKFSVGALGGRGKKAMYVVGMKGKYLICKDPHYVQVKYLKIIKNIKKMERNWLLI